MRINARLDEATERQLEYLTETTGQSISHVVRESVAQYYMQLKGQRRPSRLAALAVAGRWRSGSTGTVDTSSHVRSVVVDALKAKYPQHFGNEPALRVQSKKAASAKPKRRGT